MTVQDLQSWADQLELVRLPDIESKLDLTATDLAGLDWEFIQKIQELTDELDAHAIEIEVAQTSADIAEGDALEALSRFPATELNARTYTDMVAQIIRDEHEVDMNAAYSYINGPHLDLVTDLITSAVGSAQAGIDDSVAAVDAVNDTILNAKGEMQAAVDMLALQTIPLLQSTLDTLTSETNALSGSYDLLLTNYSYSTLKEGLDAAQVAILGNVTASLTSGYYTKADTDEAISLAIDSFETSYIDPATGQVKASALTGYYTKSATDSALSAVRTTLQSSIDAIAQDAVDGDAATLTSINATLDNNYYTKVDTDSAISTAIDNFETSYIDPVSGQVRASALTGYYTKSAVDSAISTQATDLNASINAVSGQITDILGLNISPTSSLASAITTLSSSVSAAQSTADGAAADVSNLSSTVTTQASTLATLEGNLSSGYLIKAQAGGAVSLLEMIAADGSGGKPSSIIKLSADKIILDGTIGNAHIQNLAVDTLKLANESVTISTFQQFAMLSGTGPHSFIHNVYMSYPGDVIVIANFHMFGTANSGDTATFQLLIGGTSFGGFTQTGEIVLGPKVITAAKSVSAGTVSVFGYVSSISGISNPAVKCSFTILRRYR